MMKQKKFTIFFSALRQGVDTMINKSQEVNDLTARVAFLESLIRQVPLTFENEWDAYNCTFCSSMISEHNDGCPHEHFKLINK